MLLQYHRSTVYLFVFMYYLYKKSKLFFFFCLRNQFLFPWGQIHVLRKSEFSIRNRSLTALREREGVL